MNAGNTHQLIANVAPADADDTGVTWSSSNDEIASVDENGLVSALTQGSVKITVTTDDGGYSKTCNIGVWSSTTGFDNYMNNNGIKIYPNPVTDKLYVEFLNEDPNREIVIFNQNGQVVFKEHAHGLQKMIDMNRLIKTGLIAVQVRSRTLCTVYRIGVL